jgi:hypothetical protein
MRPLLLVLLVILFALHQDWWLWREARPLVLGILPPGLFYHACYTLVVAAVMAVLVKVAWPVHLEREAELEIERQDKAA